MEGRHQFPGSPMIRRCLTLGLALAAVGTLAGCDTDQSASQATPTDVEFPSEPPSDDPGDPISPPRVRSTNPESCTDDEFDVEDEPQWPEFAAVIDWFRNDCRVRIDVLTEKLPAALACGVTTFHIIEFGDPALMERLWSDPVDVYADQPQTPIRLGFVRQNAVTIANDVPDDPATALPDSVVFSGYQSATTELWVDPGDPQWIYMVTDESIERWSQGNENVCG